MEFDMYLGAWSVCCSCSCDAAQLDDNEEVLQVLEERGGEFGMVRNGSFHLLAIT
jgi:hypothetical protein